MFVFWDVRPSAAISHSHFIHFSAVIRHFCPKRLTVIQTFHTLMAVVAMQGADQHSRSSLEFSNLAQGRFGHAARREPGFETSNLPIAT